MTKLEAAHKADPSIKKLYTVLLLAWERVNTTSLQEVCRNIERLNERFLSFWK